MLPAADVVLRFLEGVGRRSEAEFYLGLKESSVRGTRRWKRKKTWR